MDPGAQKTPSHGHGHGKSGEKSSRQPLLKAVEEVLPAYVARMQLGAGSFGRVFLMEHRTTGERVAVKTLKKERIVELGMQDKVLREIRILLRLKHPHIIRLHNVIETPKYILLVMEYSENGELFDYITQRGRLTEGEARRIFQQIIGAVEYCHSRMVVHRDLKPENILLDGLWRVKLADFGLGNCLKEGHFLRTSCGSPNYAAPEVISGRLYSGPEVDVWGCGVVLFTLLCGRLPFDEKSHVALYQKIKAGAYTRPTHVTPAVQDLLARMLVVDPLQRISIPEIRQHPWFLPWFLPTQLLQYQKEEEQRRQHGAAAEDGPRTTVQVNASSIANLHAVKLAHPPRTAASSPASSDVTAQGGASSCGSTGMGDVPPLMVDEGPEGLSALDREVEVACLGETGRPLPWLEDGQLRQRLKGRLAWLPGVPVTARQAPLPLGAGFSFWEAYGGSAATAGYAGGAPQGTAGQVPEKLTGWEAMGNVCSALQRLGAKWRKLGPYALACRSPPMQFQQPPMFAAAAAAASRGQTEAAFAAAEGKDLKGVGKPLHYGANGTVLHPGPHHPHAHMGAGAPHMPQHAHTSMPAMLPGGKVVTPLNGVPLVDPAMLPAFGAKHGGPPNGMMTGVAPHQGGGAPLVHQGDSEDQDRTVRRGSMAFGTLAAVAAASGGLPAAPAHTGADVHMTPVHMHGGVSLPAIDRLAGAAGASSLGGPSTFLFSVQFELQLYMEPGNRTFWVDLCLTRGAPVAFLEFAPRFWGALAQCLAEGEAAHSQASQDGAEAALSFVWH